MQLHVCNNCKQRELKAASDFSATAKAIIAGLVFYEFTRNNFAGTVGFDADEIIAFVQR